MFASKTPRDLNSHVAFMTGAGTPPLCSCGWQGRRHDGPILAEHIAEFDHPQHNEPNPILVAVRQTPTIAPQAWLSKPLLCGELTTSRYSQSHIEHARRVLTRLANL